ncbi:MAG: type II toxin-antitoxin system HicB family antitoxin [Patescibacteria group bacterium]
MFNEFIEKKLKSAKYKILKDGSYFGEIRGAKGVWANAKNLEDCRQELREVLEDWFLLKIQAREKIQDFEIRIGCRHA